MRRNRLVAARKTAGKTQESIAEEVGVDRTTVGTWERGEYSPQPHQRTAYAEALGITLSELDSLLTDLPPPGEATPLGLSHYLGMEQSATEIRSHEPHVVYGLFQTPAYAAAIARSVGIGPTPDSYVQRNIEQREWRQARVNNGDVSLVIVQSEMTLRLRLGDAETMAEQLVRLVTLGGRPNIAIQIVPFSVGQYEALRMGGITIMTHPWIRGVSVYYLRHEGASLIENVDEAANYIAAFDQAADLALSPDDSLTFITDAAEQWKRMIE